MKLRTRLILPVVVFALAIGVVGCKKQPKHVTLRHRDAATLLADGEQALKRGEWEEGRKTLRLIEENMPSSPEFAPAKLLLGDSFFFAVKPSYPEALVEYQNFLSYFPRHERRDYALYHIALCHYASIEDAERDQRETRQAIDTFQQLLRESPGSTYAQEAKAKIVQCWRRIAESELMVGIFYVRSRHFAGAETRIKGLLENYPEYADRERAYYYLGEALRQKNLGTAELERLRQAFLVRTGKDDLKALNGEEEKQLEAEIEAYRATQLRGYREEARQYFQKLVESYPASEWAKEAKDSLEKMGDQKA